MTQPQYNQGSTAGQWTTESEATAVDTWQSRVMESYRDGASVDERRITKLEKQMADALLRIRILETQADAKGAPDEHAD